MEQLDTKHFTELKGGHKFTNELEPEYIGIEDGIELYEHPIFGDEVPLITKIDGVWYDTHQY